MTQENSNERALWKRNEHGMRVKACCATCAYKSSYSEKGRLCVNGRGLMPPSSLCSEYDMADAFRHAGSGTGKVKTRAYLRYIFDKQLEQERLMYEHRLDASDKKTVKELSDEYVSQFGEKYAF